MQLSNLLTSFSKAQWEVVCQGISCVSGKAVKEESVQSKTLLKLQQCCKQWRPPQRSVTKQRSKTPRCKLYTDTSLQAPYSPDTSLQASYSPDSETSQRPHRIESKNIKKTFHQISSKKAGGNYWNSFKLIPWSFPQKTGCTITQRAVSLYRFTQTPRSILSWKWIISCGEWEGIITLFVNHPGPELAVKRQKTGHGARSFRGCKPTSSQPQLQGQLQARVTFLVLCKPKAKAHRMRNSLLLGGIQREWKTIWVFPGLQQNIRKKSFWILEIWQVPSPLTTASLL